MEFVISELKTEDSFEGQTIRRLKKVFNKMDGFCFYNHPFFETDEVIEVSSFLILSPLWGILIIDAFPYDVSKISEDEVDRIFESGEDKKHKIYSKVILENKFLSNFRKEDNRLKMENILYYPFFPYIKKEQIQKLSPELSDKVLCDDTFSNFIETLRTKFVAPINKEIWNELINEITGISKITRKRTRTVDPSQKKAWVINEIERQLQSLDIDPEQIKTGQQIPSGPQRIRGLAGTGKTIILSMKAAYMHFKHPEWNIVYTFNTQSLYDYIEELISKFYKHFSGGDQPDWEKIRILHGWGGTKKKGLYSYIAKLLGEKPKTFAEAKNFIEHTKNIELLGKICLEILSKHKVPEMFDAILIDEAQDFHKGFYQFAYRLLKQPKRLIWAYDELQSLEDVEIPTARDIFGEDENGLPLVNLDGVYPGGIEKDSVLYRAYRTPRVVSILAHVYGMGLFREKGPIQFIPKKEAWEDLGYDVEGDWEIGKEVKIFRPEENSPNIIEKYVPHNEIVTIKTFKDKNEEVKWVADSIKDNIEKEGILPEEILVIGLSTSKQEKLFDIFRQLKNELARNSIKSIIVGEDVERDTFKVPGHITISTVFKAKGNEAYLVYILNFEESEVEEQIIKSRNMAFTSMTRTKGWLYITGTGPTMEKLEKEINSILSMYPKIKFPVPDISQIKRYLDNIEYENRRKRIKETEKKLLEGLDFIDKENAADLLDKEVIEKMEDIVMKAKKKANSDEG